LCEKPIACTAQEAHEMANAVGRGNLFLMEAFMYRFHPRSRQIKQLVSEGRIGDPCLVRSAFCFHLAKEILEAGDNVRLRADTGGGALLDVGCYSVSVARWVIGRSQSSAGPGDLPYTGLMYILSELYRSRRRCAGGQLCSALRSFALSVRGAIDLPHDAFIPAGPLPSTCVAGQETGCKRCPGADEYQLMVEHLAMRCWENPN
jgi:hypothetical protein